ncbi:XRE family transcriptional regulator [Cellulomonas sp. NPDC089187]|uniref:helix-turn-helix domain-containing protein n=1 Tax=Cellulomonas sp. NPDC089187 TaxID=3154970 RepID=UPI0034420B5A
MSAHRPGPPPFTTDSAEQEPVEDAVVLDGVGPRLRALRQAAGATLADLSATTGISVSTLSRLESGQRRPTLELLLPLARAHQVPLDDLVPDASTADPRVHPRPTVRHGVTYLPLTRRPGGVQAYKMVMPPTDPEAPPRELRVHEGYEWLYVLSGAVRLRLGEHDIVLGPGEVAEFDTRTPHLIENALTSPTEVLALFGPQGERMHVRARPKKSTPV